MAASCAATMRVGFTSSTRMLREMSIASRIEDFVQGNVTGAIGRASANISKASARKINAGGRCRRQFRPMASRTRPRLENRRTDLPRRRSNHR